MQNAALYILTSLIWGSTWLAITFQLGVVAPEASVVYRFALASALLVGYAWLRRLPMRFGLRDHGFIALQGIFLFCFNYIAVYLAEQYLASGLVAIYHSHVDASANFSQRDREDAVVGGVQQIPGVEYLVVSVVRGAERERRRVVWDGRDFVDLPLYEPSGDLAGGASV